MGVLHAPMVVTNYITLFPTGADKHNGLLMSVLLLLAGTNNKTSQYLPLQSPRFYFIYICFFRSVEKIVTKINKKSLIG